MELLPRLLMLPKCRLFTIRWLLIDRLLQRWLHLPVDVWPIRELLLFLLHLCALLLVSLRQLEFVLLHLLTLSVLLGQCSRC